MIRAQDVARVQLGEWCMTSSPCHHAIGFHMKDGTLKQFDFVSHPDIVRILRACGTAVTNKHYFHFAESWEKHVTPGVMHKHKTKESIRLGDSLFVYGPKVLPLTKPRQTSAQIKRANRPQKEKKARFSLYRTLRFGLE